MRILFVVGSLRAASFNLKLAKAAATSLPEGSDIEYVDGRDLPHYDQDLDTEDKPETVRRMQEQVTNADALVFVTPEFNYGIPGPLKNLIDWASRPAFQSPLKGKPALVLSSSPAPTGGARAHGQLTTVLGGTLTPCFTGPSFIVPAVHEKFDEAGTLTDEVTKRRLDKTMPEFTAWAASFA